MKIGLIDVDGHNYPNLPLMKISAYHKSKGDEVVWYEPLITGHCDKVYMSKVFSFSEDYKYYIDGDVIEKGGSGYCIKLVDGKEIYDKSKDKNLPPEIEHIYPDYSIYPEMTKNTAYGFLTRGCPRGCNFCHVKEKEGLKSYKVADLSEFWNGQKNIVLCDPNILACKDWKELLQQLIDSKAYVDFNQGLDIRLMTEEKSEMLKQIKIKSIHFAWDRYEDKEKIIPKFKMFKEITNISERKLIVYVLCNFDTTLEQDIERIVTLRKLGYWAYVMLYDKEHIPRGHIYKKLQRWVNNRFIFAKCETFEEYLMQNKEKERKTMELRMNDYQLPEKISFNFEEIKAEVAEKSKEYASVVYTEDQIKQAKDDRATLNKFVKAIDDKRKEIKNTYLKPFNEFEAQCKEITGAINTAVKAIDDQVKGFEDKKKKEKLEAIKTEWESMDKPELLKFENVYDPRMLNTSFNMKHVRQVFLDAITKCNNDMNMLSNLPEFGFEATEVYKSTLDVTKAVNEAQRMSQIAKMKAEKEAEEKRKAEEADDLADLNKKIAEAGENIPGQVAFHNTQEFDSIVEETQCTPKQWVVFKALLSEEDGKALKEFFNSRKIEFGRA